MTRIPRTIFFSGSVGASTGKALTSNIKQHPFEIKTVHCNFVQGTDNTMQIQIISAEDAVVTGTTRANVPGYNIFSAGNLSSSANPYMVGDQYLAIRHSFTVPEGNYLKVFANNTDSSAQTIEVRIEGDEII